VTISSSTRKAGPFPGNGVAVAYPFTFKVFAQADILAVRTITATGAETTLALGTDYTVALNADQNADPGGTLTCLVATPTGSNLTLTSQVANTQGTDLTNLGGFYPTVINDALDRATIQIQQLGEKVDRSVKVGIGSTATPDELIAAIQAGATSASADAITASAAASAAGLDAAAAAASAIDAANSAALINPADFATAAQGVKADSAVQVNTAQTFTAQQTPMNGTLTDGSTVDWNGNTNGQVVKLTTAAARTFSAPTHIIENNLYVLRLTTGGFTPSWNAAYKWATVPSGLESATYTLSFIGGAGNTLIPMGSPYKTGA
jgi:hypothetical protein